MGINLGVLRKKTSQTYDLFLDFDDNITNKGTFASTVNNTGASIVYSTLHAVVSGKAGNITSSTRLDFQSTESLAQGNVSFELGFRFYGFSGSGFTIAKYTTTPSLNGWRITYANGFFRFRNYSSGSLIADSGTSTFNVGVEVDVDVKIAYDSGTGTVSMYANDVLVYSFSASVTGQSLPIYMASGGANPNDVYIDNFYFKEL